MKSYFRRSVDVGDNTRFITHYTPSDYFFISVVKFLCFLCFVWPFQILWIILKFIFKLLFMIFSLPFRLMGRLYKSSAPIAVKIGVTVLVVIAVFIIYAFAAGKS